MRLAEFITEDELDEDLKKTIGTIGAAGALALGAYNLMKPQAPPAQPVPAQQVVQEPEQNTVDPSTVQTVKNIMAKPLAKVLHRVAVQAGLKGAELHQFMAQCAHETQNFSTLKEIGGSLDFRKYDPKFAPNKAAALGNTRPGDGARYKGRGFIQLTGRANYAKAGEKLGLPLEKKPELAEKPEVAAKVAVWYWEHRVRTHVNNTGGDFTDTEAVTKPINSSLRGLDDRDTKFQALQQMAMVRESELDEYKVDNVDGLGSVPYNQEVDYFGLRVKMKPSTFLKLALPLDEPRSVDHIVQHLQQGGALGAPFLEVIIPADWEDGDLTQPARISGHEGRNRMLAIQKLEGDDPVEVHIFPKGGWRARHLTPEIIKELQAGMMNQERNKFIDGPLFSV